MKSMNMKFDSQKYGGYKKIERKWKVSKKLDPILLVEPWGLVLNQDSYLPGQSIVRQCGDAGSRRQVTNYIRDCPQVLQMHFISHSHMLIAQAQAVSGVVKAGNWKPDFFYTPGKKMHFIFVTGALIYWSKTSSCSWSKNIIRLKPIYKEAGMRGSTVNKGVLSLHLTQVL